MSELLDKQVNVQKESLKKTSRVHATSCKKCVMKMKERKKKLLCKNFCGERKDFVRLYQKTGWTDFDELQVISNNEGTNFLVNR